MLLYLCCLAKLLLVLQMLLQIDHLEQIPLLQVLLLAITLYLWISNGYLLVGYMLG